MCLRMINSKFCKLTQEKFQPDFEDLLDWLQDSLITQASLLEVDSILKQFAMYTPVILTCISIVICLHKPNKLVRVSFVYVQSCEIFFLAQSLEKLLLYVCWWVTGTLYFHDFVCAWAYKCYKSIQWSRFINFHLSSNIYSFYPIQAGQFIIEYCGEVISWKEAKRRSQAYETQGRA